MSIYNKENLEKERNDVEHGRIYDLFEEGMNFEDEEEEKEKAEKSKAEENRRRSIKIDEVEEPLQVEAKEEVKVDKSKEIQEEKFSGEGFLYKKPPRKYKLKWYDLKISINKLLKKGKKIFQNKKWGALLVFE